MAFKESSRKYWKKVTGDRCQYTYYTEERGWQRCGERVQQVHHIRGEAETLMNGGDPEQNIALPLCANHHVRNKSGEPHSRGFSFHPDIAEAYDSYKDWKSKEEHMNSITGRRKIDYSTSPFADVARNHKEKARRGERYIAGSEEIDQWYEQDMMNKAVRYNTINRTRKPKTKEHPRTDRRKRKSWTDFFFGKRQHPDDNE